MKPLFKVEFTSDKIPSTYYVCLECGEMLKTAIDCIEHWHKNHRNKKIKILFCDDNKEEVVYKNLKQTSLEDFLPK